MGRDRAGAPSCRRSRAAAARRPRGRRGAAGSTRDRACWSPSRDARRRTPRGGWPAPRATSGSASARRALLGERARQLDQRDGDVLVARPEHLPAHRHGFAQQRLRLVRAWPISRCRTPRLLRLWASCTCSRAERAPPERDRALQQRQRLSSKAHALEGAADDGEHLRSGPRAGPRARAVRSAARSRRPCTVGSVLSGLRYGSAPVSTLGEQLADLRRLVRFLAGAIALGLQPVGVEGDDGDEQGQRGQPGGERPPVALHELGGAVAERVRPRRDRLVRRARGAGPRRTRRPRRSARPDCSSAPWRRSSRDRRAAAGAGDPAWWPAGRRARRRAGRPR